jgi:hypothetical protein
MSKSDHKYSSYGGKVYFLPGLGQDPGLLGKKQILAQQPGGGRAFPSGISRQICFFFEVVLSDQCPQPSFT